MLRQPLLKAALSVLLGGLGTSIDAAVVLDTNSTAPTTNVVVSNPGHLADNFVRVGSTTTSPFAPRNARGQTFSMPDAVGSATHWLISRITVQKNVAQTTNADAKLWLTLFKFAPSNNGNTDTNWIAGDGLGDGDAFDGTGITTLPLARTQIDIGSKAFTDGQYLHFNLPAGVEFQENTVYGFLLEFAGSFSVNIPSPPSTVNPFQLSSPNSSASSFASGMLLASDAAPTNANTVNAAQDLTFYVTATAVPEPAGLLLVAASGLLMLRRRDRLA